MGGTGDSPTNPSLTDLTDLICSQSSGLGGSYLYWSGCFFTYCRSKGEVEASLPKTQPPTNAAQDPDPPRENPGSNPSIFSSSANLILLRELEDAPVSVGSHPAQAQCVAPDPPLGGLGPPPTLTPASNSPSQPAR